MDLRFTRDETDADDDSAYWQLVGLPAGSLVLEYTGEPERDLFYAPYRGRFTAVFKLAAGVWCRPGGEHVATSALRFPMILAFHPRADVRPGDRASILAGAAHDLHDLAEAVEAGPQFKAALDLAGARIGHCANALQHDLFGAVEFSVSADAAHADPSLAIPLDEVMRELGLLDE